MKDVFNYKPINIQIDFSLALRKARYILPHFFITNIAAEALCNKINQYLPNKKITNINFINSKNSIIINCELKKDTIKRKDFVTRTFIKIAKKVKYNEFTWIEYDYFKKIETDIIKDSNNSLEVNALYDLIESLNNLNIKSEQDNSMKIRNLI